MMSRVSLNAEPVRVAISDSIFKQQICDRILTARLRLESGSNVPRKKRGRKECRVIRLTRSLVCESRKHTSKYTTGSPKHPGIPCATVYDLLRALSGDRALCHRPRAMRKHCRELTPASRRLLPAFRSSCAICGPTFTNFGMHRATAIF